MRIFYIEIEMSPKSQTQDFWGYFQFTNETALLIRL